jgi:TIR domain/SAM domain (Sterile alpha motif)
MRDLRHLKKMADYSSCDSSNLNDFLNSIHPEFRAYTYTLLNHHLDKETLTKCVTDEVLSECGVVSCIHRLKISRALKGITEDNPDKPLDVFISYRRSNGSQLASLLKVHLTVKGFTVFIDVERLEAGKFDNNLLQSIRQARHFLLVLTPNALDRCVNDTECKDWVHKVMSNQIKNRP